MDCLLKSIQDKLRVLRCRCLPAHDQVREGVDSYLFTEKTPMRDDVIGIMDKRPALRERRSVADRVIEKIKAFVETFIDGVD